MATHAHRYSTLDLPHPFRAAAPLVALALLALLFEIDPALPWLVGIAAAGCFAAAALVRAVRAEIDLAAVRRTADRLIVHEPCSLDASELIRWRTQELTSRTARDRTCRELDRLLRQPDPRKLPSASPLRRTAVRANEDLLRRICDRIDSTAPVSARGMVLTRSLLRDAGSPLYAEEAAVLVPRALARVISALEP